MSENKENNMKNETLMSEVVEIIEGTRKYRYAEPNSKDIAEMYKMEGTMNEVDKLISEVIEVVGLNGEILRWDLDTRPLEEMPSKAILNELVKLNTIRDFLCENKSWRNLIGDNRFKILEDNGVHVYYNQDPKDPRGRSITIGSIFYNENISSNETIEFKLNDHMDVLWDNRIQWPTFKYDRKFMRTMIEYINNVLNAAEEVYEVLEFINKHYMLVHANYNLIDKIDKRIREIRRFSQGDFDSQAVWSSRSYYSRKDKKDNIVHVISEIKLQEQVNATGFVAFFTEHVRNNNGACYTINPTVLFIKEHEDNTVRLLWKHNNKFSFGKIPTKIMAHDTGFRYLMQFLNDSYAEHQVLPILKYMPNRYYQTLSVQLHGITQSDMYWIGNETSVKKIMAKAYGKSGVDGLTKHAFGGFNNLDNLDKLMLAVKFTRAFRSFKPQFFEKIYGEYDYEQFKFAGKCSTKDIEDYIKYFYTRAFEEEVLSPEWQAWYFTEIRLTVRNFKRIRSTKMRTAIRNHVKRSNFTLAETMDFVRTELEKLGSAGIKIKTKYDNYHKHKINKNTTVIMPKTGADLVEWGSVQNNCIGNYVHDVADGYSSIFGFKDEHNEWIGHLQISKSGNLQQLLGKHNSPIDIDNYHKIINWLKSIGVNTNTDFWGKQ